MASKRKPPAIGDLVEVHWVDFAADASGDLSKAEVVHCFTPGYYQGWRQDSRKEPFLVITSTRYPDGGDWSEGWHTFPKSGIRSVEVIRRRK